MYQPILFCMDDLAVMPDGTLREATDREAILQDLAHMLDELGVTASPTTTERQNTMRTAILDLLLIHPRVTSIDRVDFNASSPSGTTLGVAVYVNGDATPLTPITA
jgi:hypothetical protein